MHEIVDVSLTNLLSISVSQATYSERNNFHVNGPPRKEDYFSKILMPMAKTEMPLKMSLTLAAKKSSFNRKSRVRAPPFQNLSLFSGSKKKKANF